MSAPAPSAHVLAALVETELRLALRRGENLLVTAIVPAAVLAFFAGTAILPVPGRPVDVLLPGAIAVGVVAAAFVALAIATGYERVYGVLKRLGGAPIEAWTVIVARIAAVGITIAVQVVVLVTVAVIGFEWRPGPAAEPGVGLVGLVLGSVTFGGLGLAMAGALRAEATLAVANGGFIGLLLLGGILLPVDHLAEPIRSVATLLPTAPLVDLIGIGLDSGPVAGSEPARPLALLATWALGSAIAAVRLFRWD